MLVLEKIKKATLKGIALIVLLCPQWRIIEPISRRAAAVF
jgi:hypothetical protein